MDHYSFIEVVLCCSSAAVRHSHQTLLKMIAYWEGREEGGCDPEQTPLVVLLGFDDDVWFVALSVDVDVDVALMC